MMARDSGSARQINTLLSYGVVYQGPKKKYPDIVYTSGRSRSRLVRDPSVLFKPLMTATSDYAAKHVFRLVSKHMNSTIKSLDYQRCKT